MPVFMKFDGVDGEFNGGDNFDFPQLTTEPTAPEDGTTKIYAKPLTFTATVTTPYDDPLVLVTEADPEGAIAGVVIAATSDNNRSDDGADYSGSHLLYQDVMIPTLDAETIFRHSDAVWW